MLLPRDEVIDMLRCPRTGAALRREGDRLVGDGVAYPIHGEWPVLIDAGESILNSSQTTSPVRRGGGGKVAQFLRAATKGSGTVNRANVAAFLAELRRRSGRPRVLVIGGGTVGQGMQPLYDNADVGLVALDVYASPNVQFVADAHSVPLPSGSFDGVVVQAVLEHVLEPGRVVSEIHRVLKPNALVYAETPFLAPVHEGPYDFTRYTESGHRYLFRNFACLRSGVLTGAGMSLLWSLDHFVRGVTRSRIAGRLTRVLFCWLPLADRLIPIAHNVDSAFGVFFMGERRDVSIEPRSMVGWYKGAQQARR